MTQIAFFTRVLDDAPAAERYRLAVEQIQHAERNGFPRAWVAQHHFDGAEGGLPSPFVFLSHVAAQTQTIRLGTGVVTLPLEQPVRVAEDAVVADLLSGGRIDLGIGSGSTPSSFIPFGESADEKGEVFAEKLRVLQAALAGIDVGAGRTLYPTAGSLGDRVWQATFSVSGGSRAGVEGHGLLLSRTQPRNPNESFKILSEIQLPIVEAYLEALPQGAKPHITASRTVFVADERETAIRFANVGLRKMAAALGFDADASIDELIYLTDTHLGTPEEVAESLSKDATLAHADEVSMQVHSVDAPHEYVLRSIELFASDVTALMGWPSNSSPARSAVTEVIAAEAAAPETAACETAQ